ncbi:cytochrome oxidase putative small subunit CydP [Lysobacter sp. ESA13C]|uniref:cytochrome oxidase putative small subunit CydP n=1 Tax=Lysobacter sp. ESA13C TaxID=2862676 RepID=UPI001CBA6EF0|nr:cytochrome oxidase putative small subunit CydP [Lysobacter sp. ESA13C]
MTESGPPRASVHGPQAPSRPTRTLLRRIAATIAAKLALLVVLYLLFFSPSHRPHIDDAAVDQRLLPTR